MAHTFFKFSLSRILVLAALVGGCGSGFVEGWREESEDTRTDEQKCNDREGHTWTGQACVAVADMPLVDLTEALCRKRDDAAWLDGECLEIALLDEERCGRAAASADATWQAERRLCMAAARAACVDQGPDFDLVGDECLQAPSLAVEGELSQTIAAGQAMRPILLTVSAGAFAEIVSSTCPGFFAIGSNTLGSTAGALPPAGKDICEAQLAATLGGLRSKLTPVKVSFTPGFLKLCQEPSNQEVARSVEILMKAVEKLTCEDTAKALAEAVEVKLVDVDLVDLSPLAGLPKLASLDLRGSRRLVDLAPISGLASLTRLDVSFTGVSDVSMFAKHSSLNLLVADKTPLDLSADLGGVAKTESNCPKAEGVNRAVRNFCSAPKRD